jgi:putative component of membrane protein insertase Oxa1/YidC/SpoIIIJ protein YidD
VRPSGQGRCLFGLSLHSSALHGRWLRLYASQKDGLHFQQLAHALVGFDGPTLLLLQDEAGAAFGAFCSGGWKVAKDGFRGGGAGNFLFRAMPSFAVYRSKGNTDGNFMYLNVDGFSLPHGLGFGLASSNNKKNNKNHGSSSSSSGITGPESFRLFLPEGRFEECVSRSACSTYESGALAYLPSSSSGGAGTFRLVAVEAWAVGGEAVVSAALEARGVVRAVAEAQRRKNGTVDKRQFLGDFDKEHLLGKTFGGGGDAGRR